MVPGLEVFPRASSALILADGVGAISQFLRYLVDFRGLLLRDRKTENGELCSLRGGAEAEDRSLEKRERGKTGQTETGRGRDAGHPAPARRCVRERLTHTAFTLG